MMCTRQSGGGQGQNFMFKYLLPCLKVCIFISLPYASFMLKTCSILILLHLKKLCCYCCFSITKLCLTLCNPLDCSMALLSSTLFCSLLKFMSIESVMLSDHLILCCPLLILPSLFPSIRILSSGLALHVRWPEYESFSFSISHYNEYSGLTSFRIYWSGLLAVQGTLKNLLQHHNSKASILQYSAFSTVQFSHPTWLLLKIYC